MKAAAEGLKPGELSRMLGRAAEALTARYDTSDEVWKLKRENSRLAARVADLEKQVQRIARLIPEMRSRKK